jgi:hypothetical protein
MQAEKVATIATHTALKKPVLLSFQQTKKAFFSLS